MRLISALCPVQKPTQHRKRLFRYFLSIDNCDLLHSSIYTGWHIQDSLPSLFSPLRLQR